MKNKIKVGDTIQVVTPEHIADFDYDQGGNVQFKSEWMTPSMKEFLGKRVTIAQASNEGVEFAVMECPGIWAIDMFDISTLVTPRPVLTPNDMFFHLREKDLPATTVYGRWDGNLLKFSAAVCSPKDNFCRRTGREKAMQRMAIMPQMVINWPCREHNRRKYFNEVAATWAKALADTPNSLIPIPKQEA